MQPSHASKIVQRYLSTLYQCVQTDTNVAEVLSTEIPNVQYTSESVLLVGIQNAVHDNYENLETLGRALQKVTEKLGSNILNEYGKCYIIIHLNLLCIGKHYSSTQGTTFIN